jgi:hypothetical protein
MDRCQGCSLSAVLPDGTHGCRKYRKTLVTAADFPEGIASMRRANIRDANMTDQERTASFFAPAYDPGEFDLQAGVLDNIEVDAAPELEELGPIVFGGMEW